jgi:alpha-glucosidase
VNIVEELTEFAIAEPATAWWIPAANGIAMSTSTTGRRWSSGAGAHAVTLKLASGVHVAIHEAALVDYAGMWLRRVTGQRLKAVLSPSVARAQRARTAPFVTPVAHVADRDDAPGLYMSNLILNLNEPNKLGDVSWVKPYKYVGIWWGMHLGTKPGRRARSMARPRPRRSATSTSPRSTDFAACWSEGLEQGLGR